MEVESSERARFSASLVQLSFLIQHVLDQVSRDYGLTSQQAHLLGVLGCESYGMAELGGVLYLEKSSLTGLVDRAERRGLVSRVRDTRDRRVWRVVLTEAGEKLAETFYEEVARRVAALADLDPADRVHVTETIEQIVEGPLNQSPIMQFASDRGGWLGQRGDPER